MAHWGGAVRTQLERVRLARDQMIADHGRAAEHNQRAIDTGRREPAPAPEFPDADNRLHMDTHFLVIAIRNVLRDHDAIASRMPGRRKELAEARRAFVDAAPTVRDFRNFYEHLDKYIAGVGNAQQSGEIAGPTSPQLRLSWTHDTIEIVFGGKVLEVAAAAEAAIELADTTFAIWHAEIQRQAAAVAKPSSGELRLTIAVSTTISD
jgi:hypothetical protein